VSSLGCGGVVEVGTTGSGAYKGIDGVTYDVASTRCFTLEEPATNPTFTLSVRWENGNGTITTFNQQQIIGQGVVLYEGQEVVSFYGPEEAVVAFPLLSLQNRSVTKPGNSQGSFNNILPVGQYCILTFNIPDRGGEGNAYLCLSGNQVTPLPSATPEPTPEPTPTPSATPVTPTPTVTPLPTATPIPANPVPGRLSPVGSNYTLSYSESVKGWPSFYSYSPDWMIGMNNFFYTYKGGNLYRHNTNEQRNNFYGIQYTSTLTSVINESPLDAKLFRNISLESDEPWTTTLSTDLDNPAFIEQTWYELKEGSWFASIKNTNQVPTTLDNFSSRSVIGIGRSTLWSGLNTARQFDFINALDIGSQVSIGDYLYFNNELTNNPQLAGQITQININISQNINNVVINSSLTGTTEPTTVDPYVIVVKDNTAESHGILGHYCLFTIENYGPSPTELFAVQAELMKSYP